MSEKQEQVPRHLLDAEEIPRPAFLSEADWLALDKAARLFWLQVAVDAEWCSQQPQFRRFMFAWLDEPRFCGASVSTFRADSRISAYLDGKRDAGLAFQQVMQAVAPKMWMRMLTEGLNARAAIPTITEEEET